MSISVCRFQYILYSYDPRTRRLMWMLMAISTTKSLLGWWTVLVSILRWMVPGGRTTDHWPVLVVFTKSYAKLKHSISVNYVITCWQRLFNIAGTHSVSPPQKCDSQHFWTPPPKKKMLSHKFVDPKFVNLKHFWTLPHKKNNFLGLKFNFGLPVFQGKKIVYSL